MPKIIGTTDLHRNFRTVLDKVTNEHVSYILMRHNRPEAALIPYADYLRYRQLQERDVLRRVDALLVRLAEQSVAFDTDEVAADVAAVIEEVRSVGS